MIAFASFLLAQTACDGGAPERPELHGAVDLASWRIASSAQVGDDGAAISVPGFDDAAWIAARAPGTVAGALYEAGLLGDALFGTNLQSVPGWTWSFLPMPEDSPYRPAWWWRTEVDVPAAPTGVRTWLAFEGINFRADVWVNGTRVATGDEVVGTFREHHLDVTGRVAPGQRAAIAVRVLAPDVFDDLAIHFVDWNPDPPDYGMGLWMPARLEWRGPVSLRDPAVLADLDADGAADLTLAATLANARDVPVSVRLEGRFADRAFRHEVVLAAGETREIALTPADVPALRLEDPILWWPRPYGEPHLYGMRLAAVVDGARSDAADFRFGVREVKATIQPPNAIRYEINGRPILIRGAGWVPDLFHRYDPARDAAELAYVADLGLNALRLEGKLEDHGFYDRCDEAGILLMPGWCCCDAWEDWDAWDDADRAVAAASLASQLRRLRRHASVFTWLNGSDFHPPPDVEAAYLQVAADARWNLPVVSNATETPSELTGPSGMKMTGPYNWVPPSYWYLAVPDDPMTLAGRIDWEWMYGGAFGFNGESGPGYSLPPMDSLLRTMPLEDLWPAGGDAFLFHAGGLGSAPERWRVFRDGMRDRLGAPDGLADFVAKAQVLQYEAHRAMFEAVARNKYLATGHIQWMLNNAWPGLIWQLYDHFLRPGGTYFGAKKALRPVHVLYGYDDRTAWVVNGTLAPLPGLRVDASLHALDGTLVARREAVVDLAPDGKAPAVALGPDIDADAAALAPVYFLDLRLLGADGATIDRNLYWLPLPDDAFTWEPTPDNLPRFVPADLSALRDLPPVALDVPAFVRRDEGGDAIVVQELRNPSDGVAFFVEALLVDAADGMPILPVLWDDNFVTLLPGESLSLTARVAAAAVADRAIAVRVSGWNVAPAGPSGD